MICWCSAVSREHSVVEKKTGDETTHLSAQNSPHDARETALRYCSLWGPAVSTQDGNSDRSLSFLYIAAKETR